MPNTAAKSEGLADGRLGAGSAPKVRLAWRGTELPQLLGISKSTWHSYVARGVAPPSITAPGGHVTLFDARTVGHWLALSEKLGRLATKKEYLEAIADEAGDTTS
jgi:hypothetical protein